METKKERVKKDNPSPKETNEFWRSWQERYRTTSSGKSFDEIDKDLQKRHKGGWKILVHVVSFSKWIFIVIIELLSIGTPIIGVLNFFFKDYRKIFEPKSREKKTRAGKNETRR